MSEKTIFQEMKVGDIVLMSASRLDLFPYYDVVTRIGKTFIEVDFNKYSNIDGHIKGADSYHHSIICKKDDIGLFENGGGLI